MKGSIVAGIIICLLTLTGWSSHNIINASSKEDNIQGIRSEKENIINLSYTDVIKKIGKPDVASYTINKEKFKNNASIQGIIKNSYVSLLYKHQNENDLYVSIENDKVINSYCTDENMQNRIIKNKINNEIYIDEQSRYVNIDCYEGESMINEHKINIDQLKGFEQKKLGELSTKLDKKNPNIKIYLNNTENVSIYLLESSTYMSDKILVVESSNDNINKVELMMSSTLDDVIKYCSQKLK